MGRRDRDPGSLCDGLYEDSAAGTAEWRPHATKPASHWKRRRGQRPRSADQLSHRPVGGRGQEAQGGAGREAQEGQEVIADC